MSNGTGSLLVVFVAGTDACDQDFHDGGRNSSNEVLEGFAHLVESIGGVAIGLILRASRRAKDRAAKNEKRREFGAWQKRVPSGRLRNQGSSPYQSVEALSEPEAGPLHVTSFRSSTKIA